MNRTEEFQVIVENKRLQVSIRGSGTPLLLLNGLGARLSLFDNLRAELRQYRTIAYDQPGVGRSHGATKLSMKDYARLAVGLLDRLGFHEPVDVLGVSWGGCVAQEMAHRHQDRVNRLILASTTPSSVVLASPRVYWRFLDSRRYESPAQHRQLAGALYGGPMRQDPALLDALLPHLDGNGSAGRRSQLRAALGWTSLHYIWRLPQPTLVLGADRDAIIRPYNTHLMANLIPKATRHIFSGEGHLFVWTSAEKTALRVTDFLRDRGISLRATSERPRRPFAVME